MLTLPLMQKMWVHGDQHVPGLLEGIVAAAPIVFPKYGLTTPLVIAHFMSQASEECGAGLEMVENDNFTAAQLVALWPSHFTGSMAERYAGNAKMICDVAYGGRMGNAPPPSDDGYDFRGRGLSQTTGRDGYAAVAKATGLDLLGNPDLFSSPAHTLECGVSDFVICGCLPYAEKDDVLGVTEKLNGGTNGLAVREQWLAKWKAEIPAMQAAAALAPAPARLAPVPAPTPGKASAPAPAVAPTDELMALLAKIEAALRGGAKA